MYLVVAIPFVSCRPRPLQAPPSPPPFSIYSDNNFKPGWHSLISLGKYFEKMGGMAHILVSKPKSIREAGACSLASRQAITNREAH